jgi:hypothetical protein
MWDFLGVFVICRRGEISEIPEGRIVLFGDFRMKVLTSEELLRYAEEYLRRCVREETAPRVKELAAELGTSHAQLSRRFTRAAGTPLGTYFRDMQLAYACVLCWGRTAPRRRSRTSRRSPPARRLPRLPGGDRLHAGDVSRARGLVVERRNFATFAA